MSPSYPVPRTPYSALRSPRNTDSGGLRGSTEFAEAPHRLVIFNCLLPTGYRLPTVPDSHLSPADQQALAAAVRKSFDGQTPVYPIGGGTSLDFGLGPPRAGLGLSLAGLCRVIDYPARDMTITVEAGIPMSLLEQTMAAERQRLPVNAAERGGERSEV